MKPGEGDHVHCKLPKVSIELPREPETGGDARHGERDKVVKVSVGRSGQLKGSEADVVEGLVVNTESFVSVLYQLVHGEGGVVWLNHSI